MTGPRAAVEGALTFVPGRPWRKLLRGPPPQVPCARCSCGGRDTPWRDFVSSPRRLLSVRGCRLGHLWPLSCPCSPIARGDDLGVDVSASHFLCLW